MTNEHNIIQTLTISISSADNTEKLRIPLYFYYNEYYIRIILLNITKLKNTIIHDSMSIFFSMLNNILLHSLLIYLMYTILLERQKPSTLV